MMIFRFTDPIDKLAIHGDGMAPAGSATKYASYRPNIPIKSFDCVPASCSCVVFVRIMQASELMMVDVGSEAIAWPHSTFQ